MVGTVSGIDPQAILALGEELVVARVGERTPWGVLADVRPGEAVLRRADGKTITVRVALGGVK